MSKITFLNMAMEKEKKAEDNQHLLLFRVSVAEESEWELLRLIVKTNS